MTLFKKLIVGLLAITLGLVAFQTNMIAKEKVLNTKDTLIIGFDDTFAPFGFKNEHGDYDGFDIDLAEAVFKKMEIQYKFQPIDWSTKETELNAGNIDMIWNGYSVTDEREAIVQFSEAYMANRQVILVPKESDVQSKSDLADKIVVTQSESTAEAAILKDKEFLSIISGGEPITYATFLDVFEDLKYKRADAIVVDETIVAYMLEQNGEADRYRILEEDFGSENYAVGFRKSDAKFVTAFNQALKAVIEDGEYDAIKAKWFADLK